jgi:hypothetical protein
MAQWLSSSRPVLISVEQDERARSLDLDVEKLPVERTLGLVCYRIARMTNSFSNLQLNMKSKRSARFFER